MRRVQEAESFVFAEIEKQRMRYAPIAAGGVQVRSHADADHPDAVAFAEGIDFEVDYDSAMISRTANSRIPDWSKHPLYGIHPFDHTQFTDYGNRPYTVYAHYEYDDVAAETGRHGLIRIEDTTFAGLRRKLEDGCEVVYAVFGDSISAGGDASCERYAFYGRLAEWLERRYPQSRVRIVNRAFNGETSEGGAGRVAEDILPLRPDLVTIGYGMNDQNKYEHGCGVPLADYERNIRHIVAEIRRGCVAAIVLVTPCEPNPHWKHTSGQIGEYAEALRKIARGLGIGVADAHLLWRRELDAGKTPESLLLNNINHPNDYGHSVYFKAFQYAFNNTGE